MEHHELSISKGKKSRILQELIQETKEKQSGSLISVSWPCFFWVGGSTEEKDGKGGGGHDLYLLVRGMRMRIRYRNR